MSESDKYLLDYRLSPTANRWPHQWDGSYPSAEVQSAYSTAPADRAGHSLDLAPSKKIMVEKSFIEN